MLEEVKWGEFKIGDLFEIKSSKKIYHANYLDEIFTCQVDNSYPYVVRTALNNGIRGYITENKEYANQGNSLSFAQDTFSVFYQKQPYFTGNKVKVLIPKFKYDNEKVMSFITSSFQRVLEKYSWGTGSTVAKILDFTITLPLQADNNINLPFMEEFIAELEATHLAELEAYLSVTGLKDYKLTKEEIAVLDEFESGNIIFENFKYKNIFNKIVQGRRLKKDDQILGDIPFVMSGTSNTGIVNYISNPIASFPSNSITIDIFGNTFYRNYSFGAGDDTGVYWNDKNKYSKELMLFFATSMKKSILGKFSYGNKLRSSQSFEIEMKLPSKNKQIDYKVMQTLISAIQKLVIKNVVLWSEKKISATKSVIEK